MEDAVPIEDIGAYDYVKCMGDELPDDILWIFYFNRTRECVEEVKTIKRRVLNELREDTERVRDSLDELSDPHGWWKKLLIAHPNSNFVVDRLRITRLDDSPFDEYDKPATWKILHERECIRLPSWPKQTFRPSWPKQTFWETQFIRFIRFGFVMILIGIMILAWACWKFTFNS